MVATSSKSEKPSCYMGWLVGLILLVLVLIRWQGYAFSGGADSSSPVLSHAACPLYG